MPAETKPRMQIGVKSFINEGGMNGQTPRYRDIQAMAQAAEAIGLDSFWLADHLILRHPGEQERGAWEALAFLSALAAVTARLHRVARRLHLVS